MEPITTTPILEELRRVRRVMSAEIGHDPKRIVAYFAAIQERHADRLRSLADQRVSGQTVRTSAESGLPRFTHPSQPLRRNQSSSEAASVIMAVMAAG